VEAPDSDEEEGGARARRGARRPAAAGGSKAAPGAAGGDTPKTEAGKRAALFGRAPGPAPRGATPAAPTGPPKKPFSKQLLDEDGEEEEDGGDGEDARREAAAEKRAEAGRAALFGSRTRK
jgi:hypothetical protein